MFSVLLIFVSCLSYQTAAEDKTVITLDDGYVNVLDFGANGSDTKDDYAAFEKALATGKNLYIPKGSFILSKTLVLNNRICKGTEAGKTKITLNSSNKSSPIITVAGCSSVYDVMLYYQESAISGSETRGERVALQLGTADSPVLSGSVFKNLYIQRTGTAIYSPADSGCSGALIENIEIKFFSYRGVDMQSQNRLMNTYSNLYITSFATGKPEVKVDAGFALEGSERGAVINQVNVEHDSYNYPVILRNQKGFNISTLHIEGANLLKSNSGYVHFENSSGYVGNITVFFSYISTPNNRIVQFGNSNKNDAVYISFIHVRGLNAPDTNTHPAWITEIKNKGYSKGLSNGGKDAQSFKVFGRNTDTLGNYEAVLNYYSYYCYIDADTEYCTALGGGNNLSVSLKNQ